jgi:hypothetical protein
MNWELYGNYCRLRDSYTGFADTTKTSPRETMERSLANTFLNDAKKSLHPRRTLDQFYYPSLGTTVRRDADQTISKWTGDDLPEDGRPRAADHSKLLMVDQLWCWVLDESLFIPSPYF